MQSPVAYQVSKFEMGVFADGRWKCGCGDPAKWLTSHKDGTYGQRLARCPNGGEKECKFFLWEKDDGPEARASNRSDLPPIPRTPPANRRSANAFQWSLPTPDSRDRNHMAVRSTMLQSPDTSPTPKRYQDARVISDGEPDLVEDVLALLRAENVQIKPSLEVRLRHVINMRVGVHEAKLQMYEETVEELSKKLTEAERGGSI